MKPIVFSNHALEQIQDRGATHEEIEVCIRQGESIPAKKGRLAFRKNFSYHAVWKERFYEVKQVVAIVVEEEDNLVVVTAYVFYFGGKP